MSNHHIPDSSPLDDADDDTLSRLAEIVRAARQDDLIFTAAHRAYTDAILLGFRSGTIKCFYVGDDDSAIMVRLARRAGR